MKTYKTSAALHQIFIASPVLATETTKDHKTLCSTMFSDSELRIENTHSVVFWSLIRVTWTMNRVCLWVCASLWEGETCYPQQMVSSETPQ